MPIPLITSNTDDLSVIYPDNKGRFIIRHKNLLKMSCTDSIFKSPINTGCDSLVVACLNGNLVYRRKIYEFKHFKCKRNPKPTILVTKNMCQELTNRVIEVGFETYFGFSKLYKICYDMMLKNTLFSWYFVNPPINSYRQKSFYKPRFPSNHFCKGTNDIVEDERDFESYVNKPASITHSNHSKVKIDVMEVYDNQTNRLGEILKSKKMANFYIQKDCKTRHYLKPGHLISEIDLVYFFQRHAAYFYENTIPQWLFFSENIWSEVEKLFMQNLVNSTSSHMIVTGTYGTSVLTDSSGRRHEFYLTTLRRMAVPQHLWKMDYDLGSETGIVYIAMCNPHMTINETGHICETMPCPGSEQLSAEARKVVYCCSKESFHAIYGGLDSLVYDKF